MRHRHDEPYDLGIVGNRVMVIVNIADAMGIMGDIATIELKSGQRDRNSVLGVSEGLNTFSCFGRI